MASQQQTQAGRNYECVSVAVQTSPSRQALGQDDMPTM